MFYQLLNHSGYFLCASVRYVSIISTVRMRIQKFRTDFKTNLILLRETTK